MLPSIDPDGLRTGQQAVSNTLALLIVSLFPFVFKMAGPVYLTGALVLGTFFFVVRHPFCASTDGGTRAAAFFGLDHLPAIAAGGDGLG